MTKDHLPIQVNPYRFAENATRLQGSLLIKNMPRLVSFLAESLGEISVAMTFGIDPDGIKFIKGQLQAEVTLCCQRCLQSFQHEITDVFSLGLVASDQEAKKLSDRYEPVLVANDTLLLSEMIEDEIIVRLPAVPMHASQVCKVKLPSSLENNLSGAGQEKDNPFKVIEILKGKTES